jgi:hypothetical protein
MSLTTATTPGSTPQVVDLYMVLQLPDQTLRFLQADGGLTPEVRPLVASWTVASFLGGAVPLYVYRRGAGGRLSLFGRLHRARDRNDYRACCPSPLCLQPMEVGVMSPLPPVVRLADFAASHHSRWPPPCTDMRGNASHAAGPQVNFYTVRLTPDLAKRTERQ